MDMRLQILILVYLLVMPVMRAQNLAEAVESDSLFFFQEDPFRPVYKVVEQMPRFPGCEDIDGTDDEKYQCAQTKLLEYITNNFKYPSFDSVSSLSPSRIVVQFIIDETGQVEPQSIRLGRGANHQWSNSYLEIIRSMTAANGVWTPGRHKGMPVRFQFTIPISICKM